MIYDYIRWEEKSILNDAKKKGIELETIDSKYLSLMLDEDYEKRFGDIVLQRSLGYFKSLHLTAALESKGIHVVNNFDVLMVTGNKLFTTLTLLKAGIPTPKTGLSFTAKGAFETIEKLGYPVVLKPTIGSWGRLLALLNNKESAQAVFEDREHMFPIYQIYYLQEYVKRPPKDIRTIMLDDQIIAAIYRVSESGDWRTNTSLGGRAEKCPISKELEDVCTKSSKAVGGGILGVDCMEGPDGLVVHEINHTTEFRNTVPCTGVDIPGLIVDYLINIKR
jgi:[lysine-biosynthesis-protein LysW]--L-2-aminoadipate ligase